MPSQLNILERLLVAGFQGQLWHSGLRPSPGCVTINHFAFASTFDRSVCKRIYGLHFLGSKQHVSMCVGMWNGLEWCAATLRIWGSYVWWWHFSRIWGTFRWSKGSKPLGTRDPVTQNLGIFGTFARAVALCMRSGVLLQRKRRGPRLAIMGR